MRKLSAMVVILALLCSGMAFAAWEWDVTERVTDLGTGWWSYEYAWWLVSNEGAEGEGHTLGHAVVNIPKGPILDFTGTDWVRPDQGDWAEVYPDPDDPEDTEDELPSVPQWIIDEGPPQSVRDLLDPDDWDEVFTGGFYVWDPGFDFVLASGQRTAYWDEFETIRTPKYGEQLHQVTGLGFYTRFDANKPPTPTRWRVENAELEATGRTLGPTPEPASALLLLLGLPIAARFRKRRDE